MAEEAFFFFPIAPLTRDSASIRPQFDYGEDEELHVLIEGDTWENVNAAADMARHPPAAPSLCSPPQPVLAPHRRPRPEPAPAAPARR